MKNLIKKQIRTAFAKPYFIPISLFFSPIYSGLGSIVMFHRVIHDDNELICDDIEIKGTYLEKTIKYFIEHNYKVVSLDTAYEIMKSKEKPEQKFVVFTFDDGYIDNYTLAYPIFKKYNLPFTIYVTTSFPDKTAKLWWYALKDLVNNNLTVSFSYNKENYFYTTKTAEEKKIAYLEIRKIILSVDNFNIDILLNEIFANNRISLQDYTEKLTMNWDQIKELSNDEIVTIGAHTTNHYNLKSLDKDIAVKEIIDSKKRIEKIINKKVEHFAFPFGSSNEAGKGEFQMIARLGFKTATTTRSGNIFSKHKLYPNILPRISISPYTESPYIQYYNRGVIPAIRNKFKRIVTD